MPGGMAVIVMGMAGVGMVTVHEISTGLLS